MTGVGSRTSIALALQLAALVALSLSLLGVAWLDPRSKPRALLLVDRSQSVPRAAADKAIAWSTDQHRKQEAELVEFFKSKGLQVYTPDVAAFAEHLERACIETVEGGQMTKDLAIAAKVDRYLDSEAFIDAIAGTLDRLRSS